MFQIVITFPVVYYFYYEHLGVHEMGIINFMSLFVM